VKRGLKRCEDRGKELTTIAGNFNELVQAMGPISHPTIPRHLVAGVAPPVYYPASADNIQNPDVATFYSFLTTDLYAFVV
jgi:hypothetical protein